MSAAISIEQLSKTYKSGFKALESIDLTIQKGEIFALLGPNGAGKTTLISIVCGIINCSAGKVSVNGHDIHQDYRAARSQIGLVPQELALSMFESVWATVKFSRGIYGKAPNDAYLEKLLNDLSLWDKKDTKIMALSGGMKRRVLIAKALAHEPSILFLDEPTAGVDVELRQDMWAMVRKLTKGGVTVILTTHYIDEAEEMAERIGIILQGKIVLVDDKKNLMRSLGKKQLALQLNESISAIPDALTPFNVQLAEDGLEIIYEYDINKDQNEIAMILKGLSDGGIDFKDLQTKQTSLEEIFVHLVGGKK